MLSFKELRVIIAVCDKCNAEISLQAPKELNTADALHVTGWRITHVDEVVRCYCPECLKQAHSYYMVSRKEYDEETEWHTFYNTFDAAYQYVCTVLNSWGIGTVAQVYSQYGHSSWTYDNAIIEIDPIFIWPDDDAGDSKDSSEEKCEQKDCSDELCSGCDSRDDCVNYVDREGYDYLEGNRG